MGKANDRRHSVVRTSTVFDNVAGSRPRFSGARVRESKLQAQIIKWLKDQGAYVIKPRGGPGVPSGCPDIICLYEDRWCVIEVKAEQGAEMQPGQVATLSFLRNQNEFVYKVWPENWPAVKSELQSYFF